MKIRNRIEMHSNSSLPQFLAFQATAIQYSSTNLSYIKMYTEISRMYCTITPLAYSRLHGLWSFILYTLLQILLIIVTI